jgi:uncharacterized protein YajQ (UPF0234 family)
MPSFDIVSEVNSDEIRNAVDNANREIETRFDFRGVDASFELNKDVVTMKAEADFQLQQMLEILRGKAVKRDLDTRAMDVKDVVHSGRTFSQNIEFMQGIDTPTAKKIVKTLKDSKMKVQASIQGEEVRVSGKKRDDLQGAIALMKETDIGQPLQFKNFRD